MEISKNTISFEVVLDELDIIKMFWTLYDNNLLDPSVTERIDSLNDKNPIRFSNQYKDNDMFIITFKKTEE